jgi:hypothetical protein
LLSEYIGYLEKESLRLEMLNHRPIINQDWSSRYNEALQERLCILEMAMNTNKGSHVIKDIMNTRRNSDPSVLKYIKFLERKLSSLEIS